MFDAVLQQMAHHVDRKDLSAQVHHSDVSGQSGSIARTACSTGDVPNFVQDENGTMFMSIADGDDEDPVGIEILSSNKPIFSGA